MVQLTLLSPKGNQAVRYFPYHGYLGLTPLKIEGVVRTKVEEDGRLLPAKNVTISVRCYESRLGRVNATHTNVLVDYTQVLWSKPLGKEWAEIGDAEFPFRITIPTKVAGYSTANFQDYRVWWRIEADMIHIPMGTVGSRQVKHFDLPFIRHDLPPNPSTPSSPSSYLGSQTDKPRAPPVRYRVTVPTTPVGPQDLVSVPISLQPLDPAVTVRSASLIIERRITLNETYASTSNIAPSPIITTSSHYESQGSSSSPIAYSPATPPWNASHREDTLVVEPPPSLTPSPSTSTDFTVSEESVKHLLTSTPLSPPATHVPSKTITHSVAGVESSGRFSRDADGLWTKTLTLQWPSTKSNTRWAMGETMQTNLASVRFYVRVKIIVSSPSGTESIELAEQELPVVSTNEAERQLALAKFNELLYASYRSKSKSPRRSRRAPEPLPSPPQSPPGTAQGKTPNMTLAVPRSATQAEHALSHDHTYKGTSASSPYGSGSRTRKKSSRRPHTSAGPRDSSNEFRRELAPYEWKSPDEGHPPFDATEVIARGLSRGVIVDGGSGSGTSTRTPRSFGRKRISVVAPALSSGSSSHGSSVYSRGNTSDDTRQVEIVVDPMQVQAWEEELARIEVQSRRSSKDMLGIFKRKRVHVDTDG